MGTIKKKITYQLIHSDQDALYIFPSNYNTYIQSVIKKKKMFFEGILEMRNASIKIPEKSFSVEQLNMLLPFGLSYPSAPESVLNNNGKENGFLKIGLLETSGMKIENMTIPVILSKNTVSIPENINISLFGGKLTVADIKGEEILLPSR